MTQTKSSLILIAGMLGLAGYLFFVPPEGFGDNFLYRVTLPFVLISGAYGVLENLRTRLHMGQIVGALRTLTGRSGAPATPAVKAEAIEILIKSLRSAEVTARKTAAVQLRNLTGQSLGEDPGAWESWWAENKDSFKKGEP